MAVKSKGRGYIPQEREKEEPTPRGITKNAKITSIYLDKNLHEELRKISFVHRVTITSVIERALRAYLKSHEY